MTNDDAGAGEAPVHASGTAGLAFAAAARAWGGAEADFDSESARLELRAMHAAEANADLGWIHPTWLLRAVQDESPAVRAIVAAHGPPAVRLALSARGGLARPDRPPHPEALAWVSALWTERLVGGAIECADDPAAIVALTRPSPLEAYRLWHAAGEVKALLATGFESAAGDRAAWAFQRLGAPPPETQSWALRDLNMVEKARPRLSGRRSTAMLGLVTLARLLADCEPFRVRWALQHLPYPIVKRVRSLMPPDSRRSDAVSRLEGVILRTAWDRLVLEGRIATPHPPAPGRADDDR
jgi:hypothetical protein